MAQMLRVGGNGPQGSPTGPTSIIVPRSRMERSIPGVTPDRGDGPSSEESGRGSAPGPEASGTGAEPDGSILVADDNEDCRMALRALLESLGYDVHEAADGEKAVEVALRVQPDLVLMDIMMPGIDGLEATRRLRSDSGLDGVRIVAVSAMEGACRASRDAGCDDCIVKPIDLGGLEELVADWLSDD